MAGLDASPPPSAADDFQVMRLKSSYETFGIVIEYLAGIAPYASYDLGNFAGVIQRQIRDGDHLAAITRNRIVGYIGWLPTTEKAAMGWQRGEGILVPLVPGETANAVALTVVASGNPQALSALIRGARKLHSGTRVFFKREYAGAKAARKSFVKNAVPLR